MSVTDQWSEAPVASEAYGYADREAAQLESPFLESAETFAGHGHDEAGEWESPVGAGLLESAFLEEATPFVRAYGEGAAQQAEDREGTEFRQLLAELRDPEFDEALFELAQEVAEAAEAEAGEAIGRTPEQAAEAYLEPLRERTDAMLETIAQGLARQDLMSMSEEQLESVLDRFEPTAEGESPAFEGFLGRAFRLVRNVVSRGVNAIRALGRVVNPGAILARIRRLVPLLLNRVLRLALNKLPPDLRPAASTLARRLLGRAAAEAESGPPLVPEALTQADVSTLQTEFNANVAALMFAADEAEQDRVVAEAAEAARDGEAAPIAELDAARERFVAEVERLESGAGLQPALEQFIPAVMAALPIIRMGVGIIGRPKIVRFIARIISPLIVGVVGPQAATPLARAIADRGLSLLRLETEEPITREQLAANAIAGAVEDTVRRVAEQGEAVFEDPRLLEAAVTEAFQEAAAGNFAANAIRADLREVAEAEEVTWYLAPYRHWYKKYSRVREVRIEPQTAARIRIFGNHTLGEFLRVRHGVTGAVTAKLHLYQAIPGTTLSRIARLEKHTPGLGRGDRGTYTRLHPLTPEAAGALLREPGLGKAVDATFLSTPDRIAVGQRFYYLQLPGTGPTPPPPGRCPALSEVTVAMDFRQTLIRVHIYLTEADAQSVAARIRSGAGSLASMVLIKRVIEATLRTALSPQRRQHLRVIHEAEAEEQWVQAALGAAASRIGMAIVEYAGRKLLEWVERAVAQYLQERAQDFVRRADEPANGVTLMVQLRNPPGMALLGSLMRGQAPPLRWMASFIGAPLPRVDVVAGCRRA